MAPFVQSDAWNVAVKSYVRAKEQQVGKRLKHLLAYQSDVLAHSSRGSISSKTGSAKTDSICTSSLTVEVADDDSASQAARKSAAASMLAATLTHSSTVAGTEPESPKNNKFQQEMSPEVRATILHRQAIATGKTGVEAITAVAGAIAASQHQQPSLDATAASLALPGAGSGTAVNGASAPAASPTTDLAAQIIVEALQKTSSGSLAGPMSPIRQANSSMLGSSRFDLVSMVQHIGGISGGHYIASALNRGNGRWFTYDDSRVLDTDAATVQGREAYVLFYVRRRTREYEPVALPNLEPNEVRTRSTVWRLKT
jgi:hypothetical protein